jgi:tRNA threonylcarbamoyl adenosine modification protein (Sua5/YciO/YrdC/YwlC family)
MRDVPRRLLTPRHTIGVRIPGHNVAMALLEALGEPILSSTLILPEHGVALNDAAEIRRHLEHSIDLVIDAGPCNGQVTTVVDLSGEAPRLVREGGGDIRPFGFVKAALH